MAFDRELSIMNDWRWCRPADAEAWKPMLESVRKRVAVHMAAGVWPEEGFSAPIVVEVNLTEACNLLCKHCYNHSGKAHAQELTQEAMLKLAAELVDLQVCEVIFSGGEPLLRRETVLNMAEVLHAGRVKVSLISNGWFLDREVASVLAVSGIASIGISLDGASDEIHDSFRGRTGSWSRACLALQAARRQGFYTTVYHTVIRQNASSFPELLDLCLLLGADDVRYGCVSSVGRALELREELQPTTKQVSDCLATAQEWQRERGIAMPIVPMLPPEVSLWISSLLPPSSCIIASNGDVKLHCMAPFVFGNLQSQNLRAIWNSNLRYGWRHSHVREFLDSVRINGLGEALIRPYLDPDIRIELADMSVQPDQYHVSDEPVRQDPPAKASPSVPEGWDAFFEVFLSSSPRCSAHRLRREHKCLIAVDSSGRVHFLNATAGRFLELANGHRTMREIICAAGIRQGMLTSATITDWVRLTSKLESLGLICSRTECLEQLSPKVGSADIIGQRGGQ